MSWRARAGAIAGALACAILAGCDCGKIAQSVYIASPDSTLQPLLDACRAGVPSAGESCEPLLGNERPAIPCGCRPLCRRVLELVDQFSGGEVLLDCRLYVSVDGGAPAGDAGAVATRADTVRVAVTYRPSTCE